jgi:hypothetical protein
VRLGLGQVGAERIGDGRVAGDARREPQLRERLLLDGVGVGEVGGELLIDAAHWRLL